MKLSKSKVLLFLILIVIFCYKHFYLKPILSKIYFDNDLRNFKENSWSYSFILPLVVLIVLIVYAKKRNLLNKSFVIYSMLYCSLLVLGVKGLTDDIFLYLNSKINVKNFTKNYTVIRYDPNKVFHLYDMKNEFIDFDKLKKFDSIRLHKNQKSLYKLNDKDTINVNFKKGFLNVKFLE